MTSLLKFPMPNSRMALANLDTPGLLPMFRFKADLVPLSLSQGYSGNLLRTVLKNWNFWPPGLTNCPSTNSEVLRLWKEVRYVVANVAVEDWTAIAGPTPMNIRH